MRQLAADAPVRRAWHERYRDDGLVVVGAHAPEFGFEHDLANVRRAVGELGVEYPVVIDNDFSIWRSFDNHYWPAVYLVGRDGEIIFRHFGEGEYEQTERAIQAGSASTVSSPTSMRADSPRRPTGRRSAPGDLPRRSARRAPEPDGHAGGLALNRWALAGDWSVGEEAAVLDSPGGSIAYRFQARDLNLVLTPPASSDPVRFRVRLDGAPPGDAHGLDVDASGEGVLTEPRMFQLLRVRAESAEHDFEITFLDAGVRATSSRSADGQRRTTTPTRITAAAVRRRRMSSSCRTNAPSSVPTTIELSRAGATSLTGARASA